MLVLLLAQLHNLGNLGTVHSVVSAESSSCFGPLRINTLQHISEQYGLLRMGNGSCHCIHGLHQHVNVAEKPLY